MEKLQAQYQTENGEILDINAEVVGEVNDVNVTEAEVVTPEVSDEN
jgi:sporulation protein YlmC with PRC-barrel domain